MDIENTVNEEVNNDINTEDNKDVSFFKRILSAMREKIAKIVSGIKNKVSNNNNVNEDGESDSGFFGKIFGSIKVWFNKTMSSNGIGLCKDCGFIGALSYRCAAFASKLKKKLSKLIFGKNNDDENSDPSKLTKFFSIILKTVCAIAAAILGIQVVVFFVKLLPAVICAIAECIAVALIIELVFTALQSATGIKTQAD